MITVNAIAPLTEAEIDQLESFILSPAVSDDALDYLGIHGLLAALAISPSPVSEQDWMEVIFDGTPEYQDETQKLQIEGLLTREFRSICQEIESEEVPDLPCDIAWEEESLIVWCQGFMEGVFLREDAWFGEHETDAAELLLPMMLASELFEEPEFEEMRKSPELCEQLCEEIPDLLIDLYLLFRVPPEEKKGPSGPRRSGGKRNGRRGPKH